jgi:putative peptidoglycan lipid II flippase
MSLFRSGIIVGICTFLSRVIGYVRDMVITATFGASFLTDAFNIAFRLPNLFRKLFAEGAFNSAFIPIFASKLTVDGQEQSLLFSNRIMTLLCIAVALLVAIMQLAMPIVMYILAPGFIFIKPNAEDIELTIALSRIAMPYLLIISLVSLISGVLNSFNRFLVASSTPILLNIAMICMLLIPTTSSATKIYLLLWGVVLGGIMQLGAVFIAAYHAGLRIKFAKPIMDTDTRLLMRNMIPGVIAGGVMQINIIIDQAIASFLPTGAISVLAYADRISQLPLAIIGTAIGTVLLPTLSKQLREGVRKRKVFYTQNRALEIALFFSIPATCIIVFIAHPLVLTLFQRGAFNAENTKATADALSAFALGIPGYVMIKIFTPCFFAQYDTKTPLKISCISLLVNVSLNVLFMQFLAHVGIALATSIASWVTSALLYYKLRKRRMFIVDQQMFIRLPKIMLCALVMVISMYLGKLLLLQDYVNASNLFGRIIGIVGIIVVGLVSYLACIMFTKTVSLNEIKRLVRNKAQQQ